MERKCPECGSTYVLQLPHQDAYVCEVCTCGWTGLDEARRNFSDSRFVTLDYTDIDALARKQKLLEAFNGTHWRNYQVLRDSRSSSGTGLRTDRTNTERTSTYRAIPDPPTPTQRTSTGVGWDIKAGVREFWPDGLPLEQKLRQEPIRAWKNANIVLEADNSHALEPWGTIRYTPMFVGIGVNARYGPVETMKCEGSSIYEHTKPTLSCGCGFWAYKSTTAQTMISSELPILEVDLYGMVLEGEFGYRAEKQRVLAIHIVKSWGQLDLKHKAFNMAQHYNLEYHEHDSLNTIAFQGTHPTDGTVE